jgi:hypothetical protein
MNDHERYREYTHAKAIIKSFEEGCAKTHSDKPKMLIHDICETNLDVAWKFREKLALIELEYHSASEYNRKKFSDYFKATYLREQILSIRKRRNFKV